MEEISDELIQKYIDIAENSIMNAPEFGSTKILNENLNNLKFITSNSQNISIKMIIHELDSLRLFNNNCLDSRIITPIIIKCHKDLTNAIAMAQDHFKSL
tara:strand:- start:15234 stop:15533 length:300 start_codon:yes stop_codon:yes gene_type:complete